MTLLTPAPSAVDGAPAFTAVTYQRVSTKEQAVKGGRDEGFSIPAQREANTRKAASLGARVVAEFVDAGESARSADRPDLKRMLDYIASHQVTCCIVHKDDRLARNRLDDVEIHRALLDAGVTLVSATENIDETPSGMLLHGIMSSIAEFYSKNLATEVTKGLTQKVATGGTPMRAPIGYLNVRKRNGHGREYRPVEIDEERAPLIRWVFEQYATGEHTVIDLLADATARGLVTVPTPQRPSGPVGRSTFFKILRNPYYIGLVPYKGANHPGTHEPLIDLATWQRVQSILDTAKQARARKRTYDHYLKGTLFCGACGSRMQLDLPKNKQGIRYAYFACTGRRKRTTRCTRRAVPVAVAERLVADCYSRISISKTQSTDLARQVEAAFDERFAARSDELAELTANRRRLEAESDKILAAHFADAIDLPTLKRHQDRIRAGL
ncbi:MAG: recombinase family protein, partial [Propionicimonas sp.]|nr:recombinase family protein [Propionicimonas sp.]